MLLGSGNQHWVLCKCSIWVLKYWTLSQTLLRLSWTYPLCKFISLEMNFSLGLLLILLSQPPGCWSYRFKPPHTEKFFCFLTSLRFDWLWLLFLYLSGATDRQETNSKCLWDRPPCSAGLGGVVTKGMFWRQRPFYYHLVRAIYRIGSDCSLAFECA